jgi:hypothetical protein
MIKNTTYWPTWQNARIDYILSLYGKEFFKQKRILELGAYNGYIGAYFQSIGAEIHCLEGRYENVENIKKDYPQLKVDCTDLDTSEWKWGKYDIIINFGLFYHLEKFHKEHLINCINNCDLMFFETVVYDSNKSEIYFRHEFNDKFLDQSLSEIGGTPSTRFVEDIFENNNTNYTKISDSKLNGGPHKYDWVDTNSNKLDPHARRFWIVNTKS